ERAYAQLKMPAPAINLARPGACIAQPQRRARVEARDEIGLRTARPGTRLRADLRRAGQPDGRADAPLLAAGLHVRRTARPSAEGKLLCGRLSCSATRRG